MEKLLSKYGEHPILFLVFFRLTFVILILVVLYDFSKDFLFPLLRYLSLKLWKLLLIQARYIKKKRDSKLKVSSEKTCIDTIKEADLRDEPFALFKKEQLILKISEKPCTDAIKEADVRDEPVALSKKEQLILKSSEKPCTEAIKEAGLRDEPFALSKKEQLIFKISEKPCTDAIKEADARDEPFALSKKEQLILKISEKPCTDAIKEADVRDEPVALFKKEQLILKNSDKPCTDTIKEADARDEPVALSKKEQSGKIGFTLNEELLALHESETLVAQRMLSSIFVDEILPQQVGLKSKTTKQALGVLDKSHNYLYQDLIVKERWTRKEVLALCLKLGLMVDGAIETINDWSFDVVDAPVLEDDGDIYVDLEIVEELKG